ncbi:YesL family protein [Anoxybacteroides tepidamans]|uniref:YesL family protein n=1 Tax=Anoxybacteroides tepidamans TaxID=265948 RepID=UPI0004810CD0|nr:YesL family protein [Anoxybacillus tepidamans]
MPVDGREAQLYRVCDWMVKLAYANLLWLVFSLIGLVAVGLAPASISLFTVIRKWLIEEENIPVFKTFFHTYKKEFFRANALGLLIMLAMCVLYADFLYMLNEKGVMQGLFSAVLLMAIVFCIMIALYIFPIYVHYQLSVFQYIKYAFLIGATNPITTVAMIVSIFFLGIIFMYMPAFIPFFGASSFSFILMWGGLSCFRKIEKKKRLIKNVK